MTGSYQWRRCSLQPCRVGQPGQREGAWQAVSEDLKSSYLATLQPYFNVNITRQLSIPFYAISKISFCSQYGVWVDTYLLMALQP